MKKIIYLNSRAEDDLVSILVGFRWKESFEFSHLDL